MRVTAIVPAAGGGQRLGGEVPKQFLPLGGIPILARTILVLSNSGAFREIVVVVPKGEKEFCQREIIETYRISGVVLIEGGRERQDSVYNGLKRASADSSLVFIHDGVRPFLSEGLIRTAIEETYIHRATVVAVPVKETIKEIGKKSLVVRTLDRGRLWVAQTPQTFTHELIQEAYRRAYLDGFWGTDDSSLVERLGVKVKVIPGDYENIKITTQEDLALAEEILRRREAHASGAGI